MVEVPAGTFTMGARFGDGDTDEKPVTEVCLEKYWIDNFPVTNREYEVMIAGHRGELTEYSSSEDQTVVNISWWEAALYCRWSVARLPSGAEWEKAAAWDPAKKEKRKYPCGNEWTRQVQQQRER